MHAMLEQGGLFSMFQHVSMFLLSIGLLAHTRCSKIENRK